jgi:adenylate cyclase
MPWPKAMPQKTIKKPTIIHRMKKHCRFNDPVLKIKLWDLLFISFWWVLTFQIVLLFEFVDLPLDGDAYVQSKFFRLLLEDSYIGFLGSLVLGLSTGFIELFILPGIYRNKPFFKLLLAKIATYLITILLVASITLAFYRLMQNGFNASGLLHYLLVTIFSSSFLKLLIIGLILSTSINFVLIMRNKTGHKIFIPILMGRYFQPKIEDRIFLFLDLEGSTRIAEKLGHILYSKFIQDCFLDLSESILRHKGHVYQFVGDEAIVTWKVNKRTDFSDPVFLHFEFKKQLYDRKEYYANKYQQLPVFKASLISGMVTTAEVGGHVKTELAFHGDILNTGARLLELSKEHQNVLIATESIVKQLEKHPKRFSIQLKGDALLRGKKNAIKVFYLEERTNN